MAFVKGSDGIARSLKENKDVTYRYADSDVATYLPTNTANVGAANVNSSNLIATGQVVATGNVSGATGDFTSVEGDTITDGTLSINAGAITGATSGAFSTTITATGNVAGGNITTAGAVDVTGNVTGSNIIATGNIVGTTNGFDIGYLEIPQVVLSANVTTALSDSGKHLYSTTAGNLAVTIPSNANVAFPIGSASTVVVNAAGNVIVDKQAGVSLYLAGNSTDAGRVVSTYGMATIIKVATDVWFISGSGVA